MALETLKMAPAGSAAPADALPPPPVASAAPAPEDPEIANWKAELNGGAGNAAPAATPLEHAWHRHNAPPPVAAPDANPRAPMTPGQRAYWNSKGWGDIGRNIANNLPGSTAAGFAAMAHAVAPWNWGEDASKLGTLAGVAGSELGRLAGVQPGAAQAAKNQAVESGLADWARPYTSAVTGDTAPLKKAVSMDPFGVAMDVSTPFSLGETGLAKSAGALGTVGKAAGYAAAATDPVRAAVAAAKVPLWPVKKVGRFLQHLGTGAPGETFDLAEQAGASADPALRQAYLGASSGKINGEQILDTVKNALDQHITNVKTEAFAKKKGSFTQGQLGFGDIDAAVTQAKDRAGLSPTSPVNLAHPQYLPGAKTGVQDASDLIDAWKQNPAHHDMANMDNLRAQLYEIAHRPGLVGQEKDILNGVYGSVRGTMAKASPGYTEALEGIQDMQNNIKEMRRTTGTGNNIMNVNAVRRMVRNFQTPSGRNLLDEITKIDPKIPYLLAGAAHESAMPTGLARYLEGGTLLAAAPHLINPAMWPTALGTIAGATAFTSPRFSGLANYAYGVPSRYARSPLTKAAYYTGNMAPEGQANADEDHETMYFNRMLGVESGNRQFDRMGKTVLSPKGAVGISQMMPGTAKEAAEAAGVPLDMNKLYHDENYNETLGRAYFHKLVKMLGSPEQAVAAYNAGPTALQDAVVEGRKSGKSWLEHMPKETQTYVNRVLFGGNPNERPERASGGRTERPDPSALAARLIKRAEDAKKLLGKHTEPFLDLPDEHIAKALAVANESI